MRLSIMAEYNLNNRELRALGDGGASTDSLL